jgi:hypothetical protein
VHAVHRRFLASTSDRQKSHDIKHHFLSPFEDPPTGQPYMEGLVPIAIAVSQMTPLASSASLSSLVKLRKGPHNLPLLFQGHLPFLGVPFSSKHHFLRLAEQALARAVIRYSPISIPNPLSSSFPTSTLLLLGRAHLSSEA